MKILERLLFIISIAVAIFGFLFTIAVIGTVLSQSANSTDDAVGLLFVGVMFGALPLLGGAYVARRVWHKGKYRKQELVERMILKLAKENNGQLTIADLSLKMAINSAEAKELLDQCHLNHLADVKSSDSGAVIYQFHIEQPS